MGITALNFVEPEDVSAAVQPHLLDGETVQFALKAVRDITLFTDRRIIWIDRQGLSGKRTAITTIPYSRITRFSVQVKALVPELKIWVAGDKEAYFANITDDSRLRLLNLHIAKHTT